MERFLGLEAAAAADMARAFGYEPVIKKTSPPRAIEGADSQRVIRAALKGEKTLELTVCAFRTKVDA